ncbi:vegetative cell wall protein gp1-like [Passer montanus]|uniref:vegetative cell wall protein gp1-like n=1 Tax=Passer montanus TaxID=9160 RepID=UPI001960F0F4|nr:vegetative cell wall protein gp1-like [Passer montanus]
MAFPRPPELRAGLGCAEGFQQAGPGWRPPWDTRLRGTAPARGLLRGPDPPARQGIPTPSRDPAPLSSSGESFAPQLPLPSAPRRSRSPQLPLPSAPHRVSIPSHLRRVRIPSECPALLSAPWNPVPPRAPAPLRVSRSPHGPRSPQDVPLPTPSQRSPHGPAAIGPAPTWPRPRPALLPLAGGAGRRDLSSARPMGARDGPREGRG